MTIRRGGRPSPAIINCRRGRRNEYDFDLRRGLQSLSNKADTCDKLLESLAAERQRFRVSKPSVGEGSLHREVVSLREGQSQLLQAVERLRSELQEERRAREYLTQELKAVLGGSFQAPKSAPTFGSMSLGGSSASIQTQEADPKYKDLKKKLLMANLKILELQNRKTEK